MLLCDKSISGSDTVDARDANPGSSSPRSASSRQSRWVDRRRRHHQPDFDQRVSSVMSHTPNQPADPTHEEPSYTPDSLHRPVNLPILRKRAMSSPFSTAGATRCENFPGYTAWCRHADLEIVRHPSNIDRVANFGTDRDPEAPSQPQWRRDVSRHRPGPAPRWSHEAQRRRSPLASPRRVRLGS